MIFSKTAKDLLNSEPEVCEREVDKGTTGQQDPLDRDTETGESSSPAKLDDGEVSIESKGIYVFLYSRRTR